MSLCCLLHGYAPFLLWAIVLFSFLILVTFICRLRRRLTKTEARVRVAFLHPYCNAGGGGERVLWCAIRSIQRKYSFVDCVVYTGDYVPASTIIDKVKRNFGFQLDRPVDFVYLKWRRLVEASLYPRFTLLLQTIGGGILALEALVRYVPDIFIDSTGHPLSCLAFYCLAGCETASYVHYPVVSTDMLKKVECRIASFNNPDWIVGSNFYTQLKLMYYKIFAKFYGIAGLCNTKIMVNSSWTYGHIIELWSRPRDTVVVYPPCGCERFVSLTHNAENLLESRSELRILSVGQFRPEKDHIKQLKILQTLTRQLIDDERLKHIQPKLVLVGSCRNKTDEGRVEDLKSLSQSLGVEAKVEWKLNLPFDDLLKEYQNALIGLHVMHNEHFGIGIVECMAAGLITVAHNSGGPKMDILVNDEKTTDDDSKEPVYGFLASEVEEYVEKIVNILKMTKQGRDDIRVLAKNRCNRFSDEAFNDEFLAVFNGLLGL